MLGKFSKKHCFEAFSLGWKFASTLTSFKNALQENFSVTPF
jgi:hypothetical protein